MKSTYTLLITLSLLALSSCNLTSEKKEDSSPTLIEVVTEEGVNINYNIYGEGTYTLLFVHGWCVDQSYWENQIEAFQSNYKIVTIDLPGFGKSGFNKKDWSIEQYGNDINTLITTLELKNVILVAHSMGGDIALETALNGPNVIALVGIDTFKEVGTKIDYEAQQEIDQFLDQISQNFSEIAPMYAENYLFHQYTPESIKKRVKNNFTNAQANAAVASLTALFDYVPVEAKRLSQLRQPLFLINSATPRTDLDGLNNANVNYSILEINATGHYPMIEKPEEFNQLLKQTLVKIVM